MWPVCNYTYLEINIIKIQLLLVEIWAIMCFYIANFKMAASNPRWRPKKCQPEFLINLWSIVTKKLGWQKLTQNFDDSPNDNTSAYTIMGISCVRCELFYSQVLYIFYNNNGNVPHSTRSPLPTCFWLKAWAEPPSPQTEAPPRGRSWNVSSSQ